MALPYTQRTGILLEHPLNLSRSEKHLRDDRHDAVTDRMLINPEPRIDNFEFAKQIFVYATDLIDNGTTVRESIFDASAIYLRCIYPDADLPIFMRDRFQDLMCSLGCEDGRIDRKRLAKTINSMDEVEIRRIARDICHQSKLLDKACYSALIALE